MRKVIIYEKKHYIANIIILEAHRGKSFGKYLTVTFAEHCYGNGFIPHYVTAVCTCNFTREMLQ